MSIAQKITELKTSIPPDVTLVAVSKTRTDGEILEAYEAGQLDFGENYVQELVGKYERLPKEIRWHFIGHLQSNKVKLIAPFVHLVHGVDTLKLAQELDRQGARSGRVISFLFQVYIASEETKFGLSFEECKNILLSGELVKMKNVSLKGLMGMASNTSDVERVKNEFMSLKNFHEKMEKEYGPLPVLSMGMSEDYKVAMEAGSNMIRIGSAIFGPRDYKR
jgi:pyridoxal phosphate enzyme (YggS family)